MSGGEGIRNPTDIQPILDALGEFDALDPLYDAVEAIQADVDAIREVTDSEAILTETGGTITTDGNEQTVYTAEAPAGIFEPRTFKIDFTNQTATETVDIKVYYRIISGGGMILESNTTFAGAQDPDLKRISLDPTRYGVRVTIQNTAVGAHRAYDWETFYEEAP